MDTKNLRLHDGPHGPDWVHIDDFLRNVEDTDRCERFLAHLARFLGDRSSTFSLGYVERKLVEKAAVLGASGYYVHVRGYDEALGTGRINELLDVLHKKWSTLEALAALNDR